MKSKQWLLLATLPLGQALTYLKSRSYADFLELKEMWPNAYE